MSIEVLLDEPLQAEQCVVGIAAGLGGDGRDGILITGDHPSRNVGSHLCFLAVAAGDGVEVVSSVDAVKS